MLARPGRSRAGIVLRRRAHRGRVRGI